MSYQKIINLKFISLIKMKILGISNNLGASASLIINGKLICAIHEERLNRNKDFKGLPENQ